MELDQEENQVTTTWEGYVNWRNKPALKSRHGGMIAASFVLVVEIMENLAYLANASNLVMYLSEYMHLSPSKSANNVTNFMGTAFLLALLGGFLSDAFFTTYHIYLISALIEFLGLIILTIQARSPSLKPPPGQPVQGGMAIMVFGGLYLVALGVGGIKGSLPAHGAEQFDEATPQGRKQRSTFFNYFVFCLACGALIAVTLVVWIEDNKGWEWGFGISTLTILLSIPVFLAGSSLYRNKVPTGSPLTTIFKVLVASMVNNTCIPKSPSNAVASMGTPSCHSTTTTTTTTMSQKQEDQKPDPTTTTTPITTSSTITPGLRFLNRAATSSPATPSLSCSVEEVEDVKAVVRTLPVFGCTVMLNCCLAQLSTFSVHQAATMDTRLGSLKVPPASLPVFPVVFIIVIAPIYDHIIVPFFRRATKSESGVTHLQRIGVGLVLSVLAMAVAALVETKRRHVFSQSQSQPLPITFLWIALQYLFLGSADLFTLAGLLEFFFTEAPARMRSLATSLSWASLAMGYYLSTVIVSVVNGVTKRSPWLSGKDINRYRLDRFYWLMCGLSALNFLHYLFWASRYKYRSSANSKNPIT